VRIQLKPGLQLVSRGPGTVQIGLDGRHGTVLDGLVDADLEVLQALVDGIDGTMVTDPLPPEPAAAEVAASARRIVRALAGSGTLVRTRSGRAALTRVGELRARLAADAAAWSLAHGAGDGWELLAARRRRGVLIHGSGRTGALLAASLAATGIGRVVVDDTTPTAATDCVPGGAGPADIGTPRGQTARRAVDRALGRPARQQHAPDSELRRPDLVVLLDRSAADAGRADRLVAEDVAHLSIVVRETSIVVGPLVLPGRSPCLRCLDLHRSGRDPQWPVVLAQLLATRQRRRAPLEETALAQSAAALASLQVLGHLDGVVVPAAAGATLEVLLPDGLITRRPWSIHERCGCRGLPDRPSADHEGHDGGGPARMLR
jgi:hypothetical protein